jgi:DNA-binding response OmpR family regulator
VEDDPKEPAFIKTVYGIGYRFEDPNLEARSS